MSELEQLFDIPVVPSGEISIIHFVMDTSNDDRKQLQARLTGIQYQLALNFVSSLVFGHNLVTTLKALYLKPNNISIWLCMLPNLLGMVHSMVSSLSFAVGDVNCRTMIWFAVCALNISAMCSSGIVLQKAYLALCRQWWILTIGVLLILLQLSFTYLAIWKSPITLEEYKGCVINYPEYIPWYWFGLITPTNLFFSGIFSYVTYKQYVIYGSDAWRQLTREGIEIMCLVIICNIICATCIFLRIGGKFTIYFFMADWMITSIILTSHYDRMCKRPSGIMSQQAKARQHRCTNTEFARTKATTQLLSFFYSRS
ncbi:hypothetical protein BDF22DRAFT_131322 [Syncephalis plumigaleata]|nr:hypothetical protein BDF22DRAFT_131322 [Syncephalis plumigaleata]